MDEEDLISNMKLQKLLYYEQGYHLAKFDTPLFKNNIMAWCYGPVVPAIYEKYKTNGKANILLPTDTPILTLSPEEEKLFFEVYDTYAPFSSIGLMQLTHKETPWRSVKTGKNSVIPKETMRVFFKTKL